MEISPRTEIQKRRAIWWAENHKAEMSPAEVWDLNEKLIRLYLPTADEREQKRRDLENMPEFVL